ncbi:hypothetical protein [Streptomyces sp. MNP-20]|uniref:hypothetical protein n=1 Tax=Streptomyces sp. MNP-20 TaxID=2721165 RepID=UPI0015516F14|nr:hypothetical protein [Streptomyces sp. MNP-20]
MNTHRVNAAARILAAAMEQGRQTPAGLALALDSAQLLQAPPTGDDTAVLTEDVAPASGPLGFTVTGAGERP